MNTKSNFELREYDIQTNNVFPYFRKPVLIGNEYSIYEGATGNNRFQYFKVSKKSRAGKLCKLFIEKYYSQNGVRHEYYEDFLELIEACKTDGIEKIIGLDAYLKYWNDCFTEMDKLNSNIYSIQHFEALKQWYNLTLEKHIQENESLYLNDDVKNADIQRWRDQIIQSVENYLKNSARQEGRGASAISSVIAGELIKFYNWVFEKVLLSQQTEAEDPGPGFKPTFKVEEVENIFSLLKDYFSSQHQEELRQILKTGRIGSKKLIFMSNGNRLADAFKQLKKADIITGCEQKELEKWIQENFKYKFRKTTKDFTPRYLSDIISTKKDLCQNPILNVKQDKTTGNFTIIKT